jgi:hypothetical protein
LQTEQAMTSEKMNTFTSELVQMAMAVEKLPQVEAELDKQLREVDRLRSANLALEDSNQILRDHISELNSKIAEVTKERDDAGFRVLEAEDKASRVLDLARTLSSGLGQVIAELEPPKPVTDPILDTIDPGYAESFDKPSTSGERVADPTTTHHQEPSSVNVGGQTTGDPSTQGQSEPGFTTHVISMEATPPSADTASVTSEPVPSDSAAPTPDKPFAGKRWSEVPRDQKAWNREEWFAGGGDELGWVS